MCRKKVLIIGVLQFNLCSCKIICAIHLLVVFYTSFACCILHFISTFDFLFFSISMNYLADIYEIIDRVL